MVCEVVGVTVAVELTVPEIPEPSTSKTPLMVFAPLPARNVLDGGCTQAPVRVPEVVTGEPLTLNSFGRPNPTLVTPPTPTPQAFAALTRCHPAAISTHFPVV